MLQKIFPNTYQFQDFQIYKKERYFLLISDVHLDSVHCDRVKLKEHLDLALERNALVFIFGDLLDLMQGKYDPRSNKADLNPKYNSARYIDEVIKDVVEFLMPYKSIMAFYSPGNHETSVEKRIEYGIIDKICEKLEMSQGNYSGYIYCRMYAYLEDSFKVPLIMSYHHGYGGGGPVTRDSIQSARKAVYQPDANIVISGHTHDRWIIPITRNRIGRYGESIDQQWHIKTGTYQNAPIDFNGYAIEKGLAPKTGAGIWLKYTIGSDLKLSYNFQFAE
jgi:UDP-2,3-diacylglucosamine pyrophosphatase LpxH